LLARFRLEPDGPHIDSNVGPCDVPLGLPFWKLGVGRAPSNSGSCRGGSACGLVLAVGGGIGCIAVASWLLREGRERSGCHSGVDAIVAAGGYFDCATTLSGDSEFCFGTGIQLVQP
jgi:hypothetical protein